MGLIVSGYAQDSQPEELLPSFAAGLDVLYAVFPSLGIWQRGKGLNGGAWFNRKRYSDGENHYGYRTQWGLSGLTLGTDSFTVLFLGTGPTASYDYAWRLRASGVTKLEMGIGNVSNGDLTVSGLSVPTLSGWDKYRSALIVNQPGNLSRLVTRTKVGSLGTAVASGSTPDDFHINDSVRFSGFVIIRGALPVPLVQQILRDPWGSLFDDNDLILPVASGSSTDLTVADGSHTHSGDAVVLVTDWLLTVADAASSHLADAVALTTDDVLAVSDGLHSFLGDAVVLETGLSLAPADGEHGHSGDAVALATDSTISVADGEHAHSGDAVVLDSGPVITPSDGEHSHAGDAATLTTDSWLEIADGVHSHLADGVSLSLFGSAATTPSYRTLQIVREIRALSIPYENRTMVN